MKESPIAVSVEQANEQHYEVSTRFYELILGEHLKYSSAYYKDHQKSLSEAETDMLEICFQRAGLVDGQKILELGCGWGSMTLFMAERLPKSKIVAVSNSKTQKMLIQRRLKEKGLKNVQILTEDMNSLKLRQKFDRIVSIEMFEHMRNYELLFKKLRSFLRSKGKLFVHIFTHKDVAYLFEPRSQTDWMARYFFTGGLMPSNHLLLYFSSPFRVEQHWVMRGTHYHYTSEAWLKNLDQNKEHVLKIFRDSYGEKNALKWFNYWRIFFLAVSELFKTKQGNEWMVNHYLFSLP